MAAKKKTATRKKAAKKTARKTAKKKAAKAAPAIATQAEASVVPTTSLEDRWSGPLAEIEKIVGQMRRLQPLLGGWPRFAEMQSLFESQFPSVDVVNREKEIVVKAQVPGIDKEDIDISLSGRTLTIKGESRHEEETEEGDVHRREIRSGSFSRVVTLPEDVDGTKATSSYKDGLVELTLPKPRRSKKHTIKIS